MYDRGDRGSEGPQLGLLVPTNKLKDQLMVFLSKAKPTLDHQDHTSLPDHDQHLLDNIRTLAGIHDSQPVRPVDVVGALAHNGWIFA